MEASFFVLSTAQPSSTGFTMASLNRLMEATYITHKEVTVDTAGVFS
jgi:hypothetical protein